MAGQPTWRPQHMLTADPGVPAVCRAQTWAVGTALRLAHQPRARTLVALSHQVLEPSTAWELLLRLVFQAHLTRSGIIRLSFSAPKTEASQQTTEVLGAPTPEHRYQAQGWLSQGLTRQPLGYTRGPAGRTRPRTADSQGLFRHITERDPRRTLHRGRSSNIRISTNI